MTNTTKSPIHTKDADCAATLNEDGDCNVCGISGGEPCLVCRGVRFHLDICPESRGFVAPQGGCNTKLPCSFGIVVANHQEIQACDECAHNDAGFLGPDGIVRDDFAAAFTVKALAALVDLRKLLWGNSGPNVQDAWATVAQIRQRLAAIGVGPYAFEKDDEVRLASDPRVLGKVIALIDGGRGGIGVQWRDGFQEVITIDRLGDIVPVVRS